MFQHKLTNRKIGSVVKPAIHKAVDKTVKNSTKSQNIINDDEIRPELGKTIKQCSLISEIYYSQISQKKRSVLIEKCILICKKDFKVLQDVLGENRIEKHELKSLYRIGKFEVGKVRPIIVKLNDAKAKERLIKLRNLKYVTHEFEVKIYINPDRTIEQLKTFKKLREELKIKQAMAEQNNLNVKYVIKNNKIIEATNHIFRYDAHKLWDE